MPKSYNGQIKKLVTLPDVLYHKLKEIKDTGYPTDNAVIVFALMELHRKTFPRYIHNSPQNVRDRSSAPATRHEETYMKICRALGGEVQDTPGGKFCNYYTYIGKQRYPQNIPLEQLSDTLVDRQYEPSKEAVKKYQKEGLVKYDPNERPPQVEFEV